MRRSSYLPGCSFLDLTFTWTFRTFQFSFPTGISYRFMFICFFTTFSAFSFSLSSPAPLSGALSFTHQLICALLLILWSFICIFRSFTHNLLGIFLWTHLVIPLLRDLFLFLPSRWKPTFISLSESTFFLFISFSWLPPLTFQRGLSYFLT